MLKRVYNAFHYYELNKHTNKLNMLRYKSFSSRHALRYLFFNWQVTGIYGTESHRILYYLYVAFATGISLIGMPATMLINLYFIENTEQLITNLTLSITMLIVTCKHVVIFRYRKSLLQANQLLDELDKRNNFHIKDGQAHVVKAIYLCKLLYFAYMLFNSITAYGFAFVGYRHNTLVYNAWLPTIFTDARKQYLFVFLYQNIAQFFTIFQNTNNDLYPLCYIAIAIAHMRIMFQRIAAIGDQEHTSLSHNHKELVQCIQYHNIILR